MHEDDVSNQSEKIGACVIGKEAIKARNCTTAGLERQCERSVGAKERYDVGATGSKRLREYIQKKRM